MFLGKKINSEMVSWTYINPGGHKVIKSIMDSWISTLRIYPSVKLQ